MKLPELMKLKLLAIGLLFIFPILLQGQNIRRLSENEGLPQSFISGIVQDRQGFIWIGTRNGLARYDGRDFRIYQHDFSDKSSLSSNAITHLQLGGDNSLWIKYETGDIDMLNIDSGKVSHILTRDIAEKEKLFIIRRGWAVGARNTFWYIGARGLLKSFKYSDNGSVSKKNTHSFQGDTIRGLLTGKKNDLWVLRQKGLSHLQNAKETFEDYPINFRQYFNDNLDFGDDIPGIHERANGELMWTDLRSIFFFDPKTKKYRKIALPESPEYSVKWINTGPDGKEYFIAGNNIYSYDDANRLVKRNKKGIQNSRTIQAFLVDRSGLIWTGGNTDGITQIDLATNFDSFSYSKDFVTDILTQQFNFPVQYLDAIGSYYKGTLPPSYYLRSAADDKCIWIALGRNVYRYDRRSKSTVLFGLPPVTHKKFVPVKGLTLDETGNPLVMDQEGSVYVLKGNWQLIRFATTPSVGNIEAASPNDIYYDGSRIWITTEYNGLYCADRNKRVLRKVNDEKEASLAAKCLYSIQPDPTRKELLWISSPQGLICFNKTSFISTVFSVKQGLPDNVIYTMQPDELGYLWLGTNKGLVRFDPVEHTSRTFTLSHGLPNNEFNRFHQAILPNGKLAFGGIYGFVVFNPLELKEDNYNPHTEITNIYINNVALEDMEYTVSPNMVKNLELPYNENTLRIAFAALQFSHPADIKYRYRLTGYDNKWVEAGNKRDAVYTKLPPGDYIFEVNATNTTGKWSKNIKSIPVKISPPWWNTRLSWCIYLILFAVSVRLFINFRIRQRVMKEEMLLKQKEAIRLRELDDMKTHFFSNVTHELRTPLTLILGPAEELSKTVAESEQKQMAKIITKNANSLLNLTNQLLDMSKLEAGALKPFVAAGDLSEVINRTAAVFAQEAYSKDISIILSLPDVAGYLFDSQMMERILFNLLSNAIRFSPRGGNVLVNLEATNHGIAITVTDNGPGIAKEDLPHIFSRYYRANAPENRTAAGSGIGLSLVKDLVMLQGGTISVSDSGGGAVFHIFLPLEKYTKQQHLQKSQDHQEQESACNVTFADDKPLVLVVEDNKELAHFMVSILSPRYNVAQAENGIEALPLATSLMPDIIISDVLMPGMDGFELCRTIKEDNTTSHIPVLLLTARADMESRIEGLLYGADDYLTKPFSVEELLIRVNNRLVQQKLLRESLYRELTSLSGPVVSKEEIITDAFLIKIYDVIDENIENDAFGVEELSVALHISRTSLHRKIKSLTGMSTSEMLRAYRLSKALPLLKEKLTVAEVAYKTGFSSPSYFTRSFKEVYGITPTDFFKNSSLVEQ